MRFAAHDGPGFLRRGISALALLAVTAAGASAQILIDGNLIFNNNNSGTLAGQFTGVTSTGPLCVGTNAAQIGTVTYTHNGYTDPLLPSAPYLPGVRPSFVPSLGSPAYTGAVTVPADGFFEQTCYVGAFSSANDWTEGWTYWDSTGAGRQDLHLAGMPNPRPLATYANINIIGKQYFGPDSNYLVRGQLRVKDQASLTIAPGVVIFEEAATIGTIVVERGGQLWAVGNACEPIIVTSDDAPGSFSAGRTGGIVINGRAKTNVVNSCLGDSSATEGGAVGYYGGNDDNDCSGALRYVRVEFAGKEITPNNELNSFTWCAVGRNTKGDYLQAYQGADDSFEWFGGAMDVKHLLAIDGTDDGYDWQMGARTRAQFVVIRPSPRFAPSLGQRGDMGIEADNNEFGFDQLQCSGRSFGQLANFTIIGDKRTGATFPGPTSGALFRRGTSASLINSIVTNFKTAGVTINDQATIQAHCAAPPVAPTVFCPGALAVPPMATGSVLISASAPNPFRSQVALNFTLPTSSNVKVEVFSADGRLVSTVADGAQMAAGTHSLVWRLPAGTPSGMYFYKVRANGQEATGKLTRID